MRLSYPYQPGYKDSDTSKQAAKKVTSKSERLCQDIEIILHRGAMSAYQLAAYFNEPITSIRPRITQLKQQGKIEDSGQRHRTIGGCNEKVWRLKARPEIRPRPVFNYNELGQASFV